MKCIKFAGSLLISLAISLAVTNVSLAGSFTAEEMIEATKVATTAFKAAHTDREVYGFSVRKDSEGEDGVIIRVYWSSASSDRVSYFCHYHDEDEIDCHHL